MKKKKLFLPFLLAFIFLTGCKDNTPPSKQSITPYAIEGMLVPGHLEDAKKSGFINCMADYYAYSCKREGITPIFGMVPLSVKVTLTGKDHFSSDYSSAPSGDVRDIAPEKLSYGSIEIQLPKSYENKECAAKNDARFRKARAGKGLVTEIDVCKEEGGPITLVESLRKTGWVEVPQRRERKFIKENTLAAVFIDADRSVAKISPVNIADVQSVLTEMANTKEKERRRTEQANVVVQQMKNQK